jgi:hypothetical protein
LLSTRQSLLAKRENKVSRESIVLMRVAKIAMAAREMVIKSLISTKMRRATMIATDSNMLKRRRSVVETAEVVAVDVEAAEDSIVMMNMSTAEAEIDPEFSRQRKDLTRQRQLKSRLQLLHRRKKKLRLLYPPRNSLDGTLSLFNEIPDIK